jgi:preprotein translocase subunit YajC
MANQQRNSALYLKLAALCFISVLLTATVYAHGGEQHVMGTVKAIDASSITVESDTHTRQTVNVSSQTKFINGGNPSTLSALKPGDRVVIHAKPVGKTLEATEVKFGAAPASAAGKRAH